MTGEEVESMDHLQTGEQFFEPLGELVAIRFFVVGGGGVFWYV